VQLRYLDIAPGSVDSMTGDAHEAEQAITLKPSFARYFAQVRGRLRTSWFALLGLTVLLKFVAHPVTLETALAFTVVMVLAAFSPVLLYLLIARITLEGDSVRWRTAFKRGAFRLTDVGKVVVVSTTEAGGLIEPKINVRDTSGKLLFRVRTVYWSDRSVRQLRDFLERRLPAVDNSNLTTGTYLNDTAGGVAAGAVAILALFAGATVTQQHLPQQVQALFGKAWVVGFAAGSAVLILTASKSSTLWK
jgi:hypothetical protein